MTGQNPTPQDVSDFINAIENKTRREDALTLLPVFQKITNEPPKFWKPSIIGFGAYRGFNSPVQLYLRYMT